MLAWVGVMPAESRRSWPQADVVATVTWFLACVTSLAGAVTTRLVLFDVTATLFGFAAVASFLQVLRTRRR